MIRTFGYVAMIESISFVALLVATAVKYGFDEPAGVKILGPIHGMLFLGYVVLAFVLYRQVSWTKRRLLTVLLASVVPVAGYVVGHRVLNGDAPAKAAF